MTKNFRSSKRAVVKQRAETSRGYGARVRANGPAPVDPSVRAAVEGRLKFRSLTAEQKRVVVRMSDGWMLRPLLKMELILRLRSSAPRLSTIPPIKTGADFEVLGETRRGTAKRLLALGIVYAHDSLDYRLTDLGARMAGLFRCKEGAPPAGGAR